jgi:hypothetical protein
MNGDREAFAEAPEACIWTLDARKDDYWKAASVDTEDQCRCERCFVDGEPVEHDLGLFALGGEWMCALRFAFECWRASAAENRFDSISNSGDGFAHAARFGRYVRAQWPALYRVVGRDAGIFNIVLLEWWDTRVDASVSDKNKKRQRDGDS